MKRRHESLSLFSATVIWPVLGCAARAPTNQEAALNAGAPRPIAYAYPNPRPPIEPTVARSKGPKQPRCPRETALITSPAAAFCIDRVEASIARRMPSGETRPWPGNLPVDGIESDIVAVIRPGEKPQGYISGLQAAAACERAGKRLCRSDEWVLACRGRAGTLYPYGAERRANACNDRFEGLDHHPVVRLFRKVAPPGTDARLMWTAPWVNDSRLHELSHTVAPAGSFPDCVSDYGVADMVGNLHEWVADEGGVFRGGFFMDTRQHGEGCDYQTAAHAANYHDYSTGFRCCADPIRDASAAKSQTP